MYAIAEVIEKVVEIKNNKGNMGWRKSRFRVWRRSTNFYILDDKYLSEMFYGNVLQRLL